MTDGEYDPGRPPARRADYKSEEARLSKSPSIAYKSEAELFAVHGLPAPGMRARAAARAAQRPVCGHSRTLDAACLYRELCRRGLSGRQATDAVRTMLGTSRASVLKYQKHVVEASSVADDRRGAEFVIALYWKKMIRYKWRALTPAARDALRPIVAYRALLIDPPPPVTY